MSASQEKRGNRVAIIRGEILDWEFGETKTGEP